MSLLRRDEGKRAFVQVSTPIRSNGSRPTLSHLLTMVQPAGEFQTQLRRVKFNFLVSGAALEISPPLQLHIHYFVLEV